MTITNLVPKPYKRNGVLYQPENTQGTYSAEVSANQIRIFGLCTNHCRYDAMLRKTVEDPQSFDRTFKIGDQAEYNSYNLRYVGTIVAIGPKTVTIKHYEHSKDVTRLDLYGFVDKNWDFDAENIAKHNAEEMQCI